MISMCRTFGCTPSRLFAEDAYPMMRYVSLVERGAPDPAPVLPDGWEG